MVDNWHRGLLSALASAMRPSCFIELGLGPSPVFPDLAGSCVVAYGVDHQASNPTLAENCKVFTMSTDQFFAEVAPTLPPPELVFVDADHRSEQVLKDLNNIAAVCAENCVVVCHDTFPEIPGYTNPEYCGDSYKVPDMIPWEHVTIPRHPGCTIIRMKPASRV